MSRLWDEAGHVLPLTAVLLTTLLGMVALVVDVGSWFQADRKAQAVADAAALAGAQALPHDPGGAVALAVAVAAENGGTLADVTVESVRRSDDTLGVRAEDEAPGFFSRVFGIETVQVAATAAARAAPLGSARWAAPIAVNEQHPLLQCLPDPCFGEEAEIHLATGPGGIPAPGAFGLLNLDDDGGSAGVTELADWIRDGYEGETGPGLYRSEPGAKFDSAPVQDALAARQGEELLLAVFRTITGGGANATYHVVSWVGFALDSFLADGNTGTLRGAFTPLTWEGTEEESAAQPDFGVRTLMLIR